MGWFSFGNNNDDDDRSLIEISNDNGDHYVAEVPTHAVEGIEKDLRKAGCERDDDGETTRLFGIERERKEYERRDHDQHRYRSARVVDEQEDLEDSYDREVDVSDYEADENPAWRWWK